MPRIQSILFHVAVYAGAALVIGIPSGGLLCLAIVLAGLSIWISVIDIERFEIPDIATVLIALVGLFALAIAPGGRVADYLAGLVVWPALFWSVARAYRKYRGWNGLGFGDVKLIGAIALWTGLAGTATVVLSAALSGIATLIVLTLIGNKQTIEFSKSAVAFAPFLCLSAWVVWIDQVAI